jgi:alcohol dehydrogenase
MALTDYTNRFSYSMPATIEFGPGVVSNLGEYIGRFGKRHALLVTDKGIVAASIAKKVTSTLDAAKIPYELFPDVKAEPDASDIMRGKEIFVESGCDIVVSVGGGSSLDSGKAIAVLATNGGHIRDYSGLGLIEKPGVTHIAIPTTAGTGSETTIWAVISEKDTKDKYGVGSQYLVPTLSVCDPELTLTLPPRLTALSGIDALSHALESYINKATQPISETLSERALGLIAKSLRTAVYAGNILSARSNMLLASTMAAMAFNPTRLGIAHALAMPLGAKAKIAHAEAVAIVTPPVLRFNCVASYEKYANLACIFGEKTERLSLRQAAEVGMQCVVDLLRDVGAPTSLGDFGVVENDLEAIAAEAYKSGNIEVNPRSSTVADLVAILRECL